MNVVSLSISFNVATVQDNQWTETRIATNASGDPFIMRKPLRLIGSNGISRSFLIADNSNLDHSVFYKLESITPQRQVLQQEIYQPAGYTMDFTDQLAFKCNLGDFRISPVMVERFTINLIWWIEVIPNPATIVVDINLYFEEL